MGAPVSAERRRFSFLVALRLRASTQSGKYENFVEINESTQKQGSFTAGIEMGSNRVLTTVLFAYFFFLQKLVHRRQLFIEDIEIRVHQYIIKCSTLGSY